MGSVSISDSFRSSARSSKLSVNDSVSLASNFVLSPVAYYISNLPNPNLRNNAYYAQGYIFGLESISLEKSCATSFQNIPSQDNDFIQGFQKAYSDMLRVTSCNDDKPSTDIATKAKELLELE